MTHESIYTVLKKVRNTKPIDVNFNLSYSVPENLPGVCVYVNEELALIAGYAFFIDSTSFEFIKNTLHTNFMCQMNREQISRQNLQKYKVEIGE